MKRMLLALALALGMIVCGHVQTDGVTDAWDFGFVVCILGLLFIAIGSERDFF